MIPAAPAPPFIPMHEQLAKAIELEARKRLHRWRKRERERVDYQERFSKRTGLSPTPSDASGGAPVWSLHKHFDPIYCIRHRRFLAKALWRKLDTGAYKPLPSARLELTKPGGGVRHVHLFSIPDAALSNMLAKRVIERNESLYSGSSYAYRRTKRALDAVITLDRLCREPRVYLVQCDFKAYFDSIDHGYLRQVLTSHKFLLRGRELRFIDSILAHECYPMDAYGKGKPIGRKRGIPQGLSVSLFLANAAAHEMDESLDRLNGVTVRFADDVVLVSFSYEDAVRAFNAVLAHSARAGTPLNHTKTLGVSMLSSLTEEMRTVNQVDFLGYAFGPDGLCLAERTIRRIKRRVSLTIYRHLILYPRRGQFDVFRIGPNFVDWDLVTCINELRRYIYGGLSEAQVSDHLSGGAKLRTATGPMAYFCLNSNRQQLRELDGWLVNALRRAYRERVRILTGLGHTPARAFLTSQEIINGSWYTYTYVTVETACPSFHRAWRSGRRVWFSDGGVAVKLPAEAYVP